MATTPIRHRHVTSLASSRGVTYLWVLFAVALVAVSLASVADLWVSTAHRQKREQLAWVGAQFRDAIGSYYESGPGGSKSYPRTLEDLLDDRRFAVTRRHLRRIYYDPFSGRRDWELVFCTSGGVCGVRTKLTSEAKVFEFISNEHTSKNLMIAGVRRSGGASGGFDRVREVMGAFGIREFQLLQRLAGQAEPVWFARPSREPPDRR